MKNPAVTQVVVLLLVILVFPASALAAVNVESTIGEDIYVSLDFSGIDPTTYTNIKANTRFNATTIPQIIMQNLAQKNLKRAGWGYARVDYNDTESSVRVAFHLGGSDVISFTVDKTSMVRTYRVSTDWRKFRVDLADGFSADLAEYFSTPVSQWQETNRTDALGVHPAYCYERSGQDSLHVSFCFILPATATDVQASDDTIVFEVAPLAEDVFLNSPFLILAAVLAISIVVVAYRKVRA